MAEVRKITIEIIEGGGGGGEDENEKKPKKTKEKKSDADKAKKKIADNAISTAKQIIISGVENTLQRQYTLTENYMAQTTYSNAKKSIAMATSLGTTIRDAAITGFAAGPAGIAVSVGVAVIGWAFNQQIEYQNRMSSYFQSLNASNYQSDFSQVRAGLIDGSKGTEN